jgi:high frequency lysogenization protein
MLWKQCGGSRWRFIFFRQKMRTEIEFLLSELETKKGGFFVVVDFFDQTS